VGTNESYKNYIKPLFVYNDIPETNAFSCCYNKILSDVVTMCKGIDSPLIVITCGITGTVLSADFSKHGIQALDIGSFFEQISALHHQK